MNNANPSPMPTSPYNSNSKVMKQLSARAEKLHEQVAAAHAANSPHVETLLREYEKTTAWMDRVAQAHARVAEGMDIIEDAEIPKDLLMTRAYKALGLKWHGDPEFVFFIGKLGIDTTDYAIIQACLAHQRKWGAFAYPKVQTIARYLGLKKDAIKRRRRKLQDLGYLKLIEQFKGPQQVSSRHDWTGLFAALVVLRAEHDAPWKAEEEGDDSESEGGETADSKAATETPPEVW